MDNKIIKKDLLRQLERLKEINQALFKISNAVSISTNLFELYAFIHHALSPVIDVTNFFIAIYDNKNDSISFPYCVDEMDGILSPVKGIKSTASLTAEVIRSENSILIGKDETITWRESCGFKIPKCTPSEVWLGVPLKNMNQVIGVIAVQSYKNPGLYDETDREILVSVADQVGGAIESKRSDEKREKLILKLQAALEEVKTLQGILPICSGCKKIRDDKGYWNQIENYIQKNSGAQFSHGVCPECCDELYGNEAWYIEMKKEESQ
jgi:transcriptional regulator with GAF, ATPase, and Fis domain